MFPDEFRSKKMWSFVCWSLVNLALIAYLVYIILINWDKWKWTDVENCLADLSWWVMIYLVFQIMHLIRKLSLIGVWAVAKDPTIA